MAFSCSFKENRPAISLFTPLSSQAIAAVMSLAFCPQVVSPSFPALQIFREASLSNRSFIFLDSGMSRAVQT